MATLQQVIGTLADLKVSIGQLAVVLADLKANPAARQEEVDAAAVLVGEIKQAVDGALA